MEKDFDPDILDDADPEIIEFMAEKFEKNYDEEMMNRIFDMAEEKYRVRMKNENCSVIPDEPFIRPVAAENKKGETYRSDFISASENTNIISNISGDPTESGKKLVKYEKRYSSAILKAVSFAAAFLLAAGAAFYGAHSLQNINEKYKTDPGYSDSDEDAVLNNKEPYADVIKQNKIERELKTAVSSQTASREDVFDLMMNTIDYYNKASGRVYYGYSGGELFSSEFQCDMLNISSFSKYTVYSSETTGDLSVVSDSVPEYEYHYYGDETNMICMDIERKKFRYDGMMNLNYDMEYVQHQEKYNEEDHLTRRVDATNVYMSDTCLYPVQFALKFLFERGSWNIADVQNYEGRECYHITGGEEEYIPELGIVSFDMLVDAGTGVLLRYEGFNEQNELKEFVYTKDIRFDEEAKPVRNIDMDALDEYTFSNSYAGFEGELDDGLMFNIPFEISVPVYYQNAENDYSLHNIPHMEIDHDKIYENIEIDTTDTAAVFSISDLFDISEYVAEFTVLNKRYIMLDSPYPVTVYNLRVERSVSGGLQEGDQITLAEFGGFMNIYQYLEEFPTEGELEDYKNLSEEERINNYVYLYSEKFPEYRTGERLVAFLEEYDSFHSDLFSSVNGGIGVFRFKDKDILERAYGPEYSEIPYSDILEAAQNTVDQ